MAPDVQNNMLVQQLNTAVAAAEAKFNVAATKYGVSHPYISRPWLNSMRIVKNWRRPPRCQ